MCINLFIFFRVKENEPKENAHVRRPCELPCASRKGHAQHNSLRSDKHFAPFALYGDARHLTKGKVKTN